MTDPKALAAREVEEAMAWLKSCCGDGPCDWADDPERQDDSCRRHHYARIINAAVTSLRAEVERLTQNEATLLAAIDRLEKDEADTSSGLSTRIARIADLEAEVARLRADKHLLDKLNSDVNLELSWGSDDVDEECFWRVHRCTGNRSDREWTKISDGPSVREALINALAPQPEHGKG